MFSGALDQHARQARSVSVAARHSDGADDIEPALIGIFAGLLDLSEHIEGAEIGDVDRDFRVTEILLAAEFLRQRLSSSNFVRPAA